MGFQFYPTFYKNDCAFLAYVNFIGFCFFRRFYQATGWTFRGIQAAITRSHGEDGKRKDRKRTRDWNGKFNFPFLSYKDKHPLFTHLDPSITVLFQVYEISHSFLAFHLILIMLFFATVIIIYYIRKDVCLWRDRNHSLFHLPIDITFEFKGQGF